jgi:Glycine zipper
LHKVIIRNKSDKLFEEEQLGCRKIYRNACGKKKDNLFYGIKYAITHLFLTKKMYMKKLFYSLSILSVLTFFTTDVTQAQTKKKHMKKGTKDALIGGVGGAAVGAAVSHDKSKGAIIGGVAGAGAGYLHGHKKDKKAAAK